MSDRTSGAARTRQGGPVPSPRPGESEVSPGRDVGMGIGVGMVRQGFVDSVGWTFADRQHQVLIWHSGTAGSKEVAFDGGRGARVIPRMSNLWLVPAGHRAAGEAKAAAFEFLHVRIPAVAVGGAELNPVVGLRDPVLHRLIERLASTADRHDVVVRLLRSSLVDSLRFHLLDAYAASPFSPRTECAPLTGPLKQQLIDYMRSSSETDLDLEQLAGLAGMSVSRFRKAFSEAFHTTPHQYLLDLRIEQAKALVTSTQMSMSEISVLTGFSSPSHFATAFKARVGVSPTAYRKDSR
ncbi:MAG: AraC family transcriptional regulator [Gordonia sp. (in: high G+C Gram-positive bacteria)]|uniref:helix-turn-helix transcriptional regulator n=1 Tax=Gordonia sp. (in: high G+C Gram-positive bacteria) TaxID=84139 RepID=UPI003BB625F2